MNIRMQLWLQHLRLFLPIWIVIYFLCLNIIYNLFVILTVPVIYRISGTELARLSSFGTTCVSSWQQQPVPDPDGSRQTVYSCQPFVDVNPHRRIESWFYQYLLLDRQIPFINGTTDQPIRISVIIAPSPARSAVPAFLWTDKAPICQPHRLYPLLQLLIDISEAVEPAVMLIPDDSCLTITYKNIPEGLSSPSTE